MEANCNFICESRRGFESPNHEVIPARRNARYMTSRLLLKYRFWSNAAFEPTRHRRRSVADDLSLQVFGTTSLSKIHIVEELISQVR